MTPRAGSFAALLLVACSGATAPAAAPGAGSATATASKPRTGKIEEFPSQGGDARAYIAAPSAPGKHAAILVIQEFWGMNDWIMDDADRFASQGYVAAAVDLYRGKVAQTPEVAHELMRALDEPRGLADLKAAFEVLARRPDVDPNRIGAIGWCMGGGYAITFAANEPRLKAVVMNYGHLLTQPQASDKNEIAKNTIDGNESVGIAIVSYLDLMADPKAPGYDLYPQGNWVHDNMLSGDGQMPKGIAAGLKVLVGASTIPELAWDGEVDSTKDNTDGSLTNCFSGNNASFVDFDFAGGGMMTSTDITPYTCMKTPLKALSTDGFPGE